MTQWLRILAFLLACACSYLLLMSARRPRGPDPPPVTAAPIGPLAYYGLAIQVDSGHQPIERYGPMIREIAALGANTVLFSVNGYQLHAGSAEISVDPQKTPTDEQWRQLFGLARAQGLKVIFMPKILLSKPRGREWRGVINPGPRWNLWFGEYRDFILHYARLAAQSDVEVFLVGSELVSAEKHTADWEELIAAVRQSGPHLLLGYSANWDHYTSIRFWDDLDLVAMTSYHQTTSKLNPTLQDLTRSWQRHRSKILDWQHEVRKPILFTEVGWCSQEGCSSAPWNYYLRDRCTPQGLLEQRLNYQAFIHSWSDVPQVAGIMWWEWTPGAGGRQDRGYTPKNKPAEAVLKDWFARQAGASPGQGP